jgi:protein phosphatase
MTAKSEVDQLVYGFLTDIGRKREANQDSFAVLSRADLGGRLDGLFVVADGMGGARGGEVASRIVVQSLPEVIDSMLRLRPGGGPYDVDQMLYDAIARANHNVYMQKVENQDLRGMGTTCVAAIVNDDHLTIGNVGDSRIYMLRQGLLQQLTEDHSEVYEQVKAGNMTREEARLSKFRNRITRFIGARADVEPDVATFPLAQGDTVLICSDGLTVELSDARIARILATYPDPQQTCEQLVAAALQHGGSDNVTVVVLRYGEFTPLELPAPPDVPEDEPDTDPDAHWRKSQSGQKSKESQRSKSRSGWETPVIGLLTTALILSLVALVLVWNGTIKRPTVKPPAPQVNPPPPPPITYDDHAVATVVYNKQPLLDSVLQIAPDGSLIAVTTSGYVIAITPQGEERGLGQFKGVARPTPPKNRKPPSASTKSLDTAVDMAFDAQGNRYQIHPGIHWIEQVNSQDTIVNSSIGKGTLKSPTRIAIAPQSGDIYVIDNHQLKRISAKKR